MGEFHKPLVKLRFGTPLIRRTVVQLRSHLGKDSAITVVASPHNVEDLSDALNNLDVRFAIQRYPHGPSDALRVGLQLRPSHKTHDVFVVLADNVFTDADVSRMTRESGVHRIGVSYLNHIEARRFTWRHPATGVWHEKKEPPATSQNLACWIGGFTGSYRQLDAVTQFALPHDGGEVLLGPRLDALTTNVAGHNAHLTVLDARDIGTYEAYTRYINDGNSEILEESQGVAIN